MLTIAGSILNNNGFNNNQERLIKIAVNKFNDVENNLYLNADYLIDVDVSDRTAVRRWVDIIIKGYTLNMSGDMFNCELYTKDDQLIVSDWPQELTMKRRELTNASSKEKHFIIRDLDGQKYVFVSGIISLKNVEFKLIVSKSIQQVYVERKRDYEFFWFINVVISALLAVGMLIISKKLTEPIVSLSNVSVKIGQGEYSRRVEESNSQDEIGILERNFNKMADVIEKNIQELHYMNEAKQRFIDSFNHEIKTPITSIIGYSDLLLRSKLDEKRQGEALYYINSEAKRIAMLNQTLLAMTMIREQMREEQEVDLMDCIREASDTLRLQMSNRDIRIEIDGKPIKIIGDAQEIRILLVNLLDNANKASSNHSKIDIRGELLPDSNTYQLLVRDYGVGMEQEEIDKILEPFYMVDKARTRKENGIGLGLSICDEICKKNEIKFSISSVFGEGTTVYLTFPKERIIDEE